MFEAFKLYGASAIPMHMALFNIPMKIAIKFNIPNYIWRKSAQEYGGKKESANNYLLDKNGMIVLCYSRHKTQDWISKII